MKFSESYLHNINEHIKNMNESAMWEKGSIENSKPEKGRGLKMYEDMLGFKIESLEGKTVLDLGAGPGAKFEKEIKKSGVNARVISVSPDFADEKYREALKPDKFDMLMDGVGIRKIEKPLAVAAVGEALPFRDECIDEILALYSVSRYSKENRTWLFEACRVLKKGGEMRVGPFMFGSHSKDMSSDLVIALEDLGFEYEFTETAGLTKTLRYDEYGDNEICMLVVRKIKRNDK